MKILITGGTGFLGQKLARRLNGMDHQVTVIGRNEQIGAELETEGITFLKADLTDCESIHRAHFDKEIVFHCGALSAPWGRYEDFYQTNVIGTENVVNACIANDVKRLIHVSTPSIYFDKNERTNVSETDAISSKFLNHYATTKFLAERVVDKAFDNGLPVVTLRPRAIFGPGDNAIIPRLIQTNEDKFIPFINHGRAVIDLVYVENVVDAMVLEMNADQKTLGQKYNISNGERWILADVLKKLFQTMDVPFRYRKLPYPLVYSMAAILEWLSRNFQNYQEPVLNRYTVTVLSKSQTISIDKARAELGYTPRVSVEDGIHLFAEWWRDNEKSKA
ncbi:NAD-dependent epimerase/dehydratase family protein [Gracilibacillus oryzae]|uniref:NAD-dependent epimerase/dehydratase family protein n=1 Tax=Gracilibacillus oryzae TaxID=1672701 RepID=A0A7C8KNU9_9BACI|nr:NAD-dependent epimerase/dehydratase family protein [Gracilibacillus oryzae]KAB8129182.1 NAD-dependent epimerase/dehydratase family protein [Gracilibacillus oryzae]